MDDSMIIAGIGVAIAALFWIVTQWNIVRTKTILLKTQVEMRDHAAKLINEQFGRMDSLMNEKIVAMESRINGSISLAMEQIDIPEFDLAPIQQMINAQGQTLKADVVESCTQAFNGMQSGAVRALQGQLKPYDELFDNVGGEIMSQLAQNASPLDLAKAEILGTKVSDKYAREHPAAAMLIKAGKIQMMQMLDSGQIPGLTNVISTQNAVATPIKGPLG